MIAGKKIKYIGLIILIFLLSYCFWNFKNAIEISDYLEPEVVATHYTGKNFVASETCLECHQDIYKAHLRTAHFNTSSFADSAHILGNFEKGENELNLTGVRFKMIEERNDFFQLSKAKFGDTDVLKSKIDIVIGSGVKGQSYLHWEDDRLSQLQVSYFKPTGNWVNSPNFPNQYYTRKVDDNCLKCHVTFAKNTNVSGNGNMYDREQMLLGVDCQRCHGPSEEHVKYHRANPDDKQSSFISSYTNYTRQQRLDACAVCHSGLQAQQIKGNPFLFLAGDTLSQFSKNYKNYDTNLKLDVHGNQMGLLGSSSCFINSTEMDCVTCHDPHVNQRSNANVFNSKCLTCHDTEKINSLTVNTIHNSAQNCISCHMPLVPSEVMKLKIESEVDEIPVYIRTHLIGIYK
ncbi:multiheme c-type cytochrome [Maribacter sp.]|uniref:multiheme c-type cytochrome n=1 Tax=Maribacter sp. TaxID=1897614 RepID=UPI003298DFEA